jgi:hypothetical protein
MVWSTGAQEALTNLNPVVAAVVGGYLGSQDFNGVPVGVLTADLQMDWRTLKSRLNDLVESQQVGILFADSDLNPYIPRHGFEPIPTQLAKLAAMDDPADVVAYPMPSVLEQVVERPDYVGRPYTLALALGAPQLAFRAFDLHVLETYRNDPRYLYQTDDVGGSISVGDDALWSEDMQESDQVLLQTFGFAYDEEMRRAVAVFLWYLHVLSPEHQQIWKARELGDDFRLHPDYFRRSILGEWGERASIFSAFLTELHVINRMSDAIGRPALFRKDYGPHAEGQPKDLAFLVRPTLEEFNSFVLTLDKLISDNINKAFFRGDVPDESEEERADGKIIVRPRGTVVMLDDWVRKSTTLPDWAPWEEAVQAMREVRKLRQRPAHAIDENVFDQTYFQRQRDLIISAYQAVRTIRLLFANHPAARLVEVPDWLFEGRIWDF